MRWDERAFGREYDLDVFNIVAVSDFNMGAMENKGLNIFNDKYVLAAPETATDQDYANIEAIIAHEYFHNWSGNRVTCRDWFQLCLKEGLTVFRDQEFSSDERSRPVHRIAEVRDLAAAPILGGCGPPRPSRRPDAIREINNFYTATVYEKGAEIVRMLKTLVGEEDFRRGMDLYFERCDGTAATVEEFLARLRGASGRDLSDFARWYEQAGTPASAAEAVRRGARRPTGSISPRRRRRRRGSRRRSRWSSRSRSASSAPTDATVRGRERARDAATASSSSTRRRQRRLHECRRRARCRRCCAASRRR